MTNSVTRNFKFYKIVIVLTCYMSLADAQCSQDNNGAYRFGSECGFICHCLKYEQCNVSTGECPSGCDFAWVGPGCQRNNIAYQQMSRNSDNLPVPYSKPGHLANDHILSTCSYTGNELSTARSVSPWWRVWMPYNFTLRRMEILTLDSKRKYFDGFKVLVEYVPMADRDNQTYQPDLSQICYTHSNTSLESVSMTVVCDTAYTGNHVKIQLGRRKTQLVLCDVRIYGECAENVCTYDCNKLCFCKDVTANDKISGVCTNGCTGRWSGNNGACDKECAIDKWGATCDTQCGYCRNYAPCDAVTGKCPSGCEDGYKNTQNCDIECDDGNYGQNCQSNCTGYCKNNAPCRKTNGHCPDGCAPGYTGEKCSERCSLGYYGNDCSQRCSELCNGGLSSCNHVDGICLYGCLGGYQGQLCNHECENGRWGVSCANPCGMCLTGTCNHIDGICIDGTRCKAGYKFHPLCNQECVNGTFGLNCIGQCNENCTKVCDKASGTCTSCTAGWKGTYCNTECETGRWGVNCANPCGMCLTGTCNHIDGICTDGTGCKAGYKFHPLCNQECSRTEWGINCIGTCGKCRHGDRCDRASGTCSGGCILGYKTTLLCNDECEDGTYGVNCSIKCGSCQSNSVCNKTTGVCHEGCSEGFTGNICLDIEETTEATTTATTTETTLVIAVIVGVGAAIIIVIILGVLVILWFLRKTQNRLVENISRSNENKQENRVHRGMVMSDISSESTASGVKPTDRSRDTYDTLQVGNADEHQYEL